ncbi:MAG: tetratricopeptide repeat protein [Chitinophagales bacterium]
MHLPGYRSILVVLFLFSVMQINGQNRMVDSLSRIVDSLEKLLPAQQEDTNKALTLSRLSERLLILSQTKKARENANLAIVLSRKLNFKRIEASAYENRGYTYLWEGDTKQAEKDFLTALDMRKEINYKYGIARNYISLSDLYRRTDNPSKELLYLYEALKLYQEMNDIEGIGNTLHYIGNMYRYHGADSDAKFNLQLSLQQFMKIGKKENVEESLMALGELDSKGKNYDSAIKKYSAALELSRQSNPNGFEGPFIYMLLGDAYQAQGESAFTSKNKKLALEKFDQALKYYDTAITNSRKKNDDHWKEKEIDFNMKKAKIFVRTNRLPEARAYLEKFIAKSAKYGSRWGLEETYASLSSLDSIEGHFQNALDNYKKYVLYRDSNSNIKSGAQFNLERQSFEYERKEALARDEQTRKDIDTQKTKSRQLSIILLLGGLSLGVFGIAYIQWRNNKRTRKTNLELAQQKLKAEKALTDLQSTQAQLIQSEKMASLGELTAGIAHEIQNPLNFVNNFSEVNAELIEEMKEEIRKGKIEDVNAISETIRENNVKIGQHGKRAESIVKGMLQHSRSSSGQKEPTDINNLVNEYLNLAYHGFRAKDPGFSITMVKEFDKNLGKINIKRREIGRVLLNLYNNAFYSVIEKNKKECNGYDPTVCVYSRQAGNKVEIEIQDNGKGIPNSLMNKIFQPFFTTKPAGLGTGLGLSLSYDIIKAAGGEIKVESRQDEFAKFTVQLPYETEVSQEPGSMETGIAAMND